METTKRIRLAMLGALVLTGCQLKIDPSILPIIPSPGPTGRPVSPPPPSATPQPGDVEARFLGYQKGPSWLAQSVSIESEADFKAFNDGAPGDYGRNADFAKERVVALYETSAPSGRCGGREWFFHVAGGELVFDVRTRPGPAAACAEAPIPSGSYAVFVLPKAPQAIRGARRFSEIPRPSTRPSATPSPRPTTGVWFPPPPPPCLPAAASQVALSGTVFDEQGVPFPDGVEVRVSTKGFAFNTTVYVTDGRYWVTGAPAGEKLEITALHQATGEARRRFVTPAAEFDDCGPNGFAVVNFGGPKSADDPLGHRYPLPTVESTYERKQDGTTVSGAVYDIAGNPMDARITLTSLLAETPFTATVDAQGGRYVVNQVPAGVPMEIRAEADGYSARARADVFFEGEGGRKGNVVNFGGDPSVEDPYAPQYALAPTPPEDLVRPVAVKGQVATIDDEVVTVGVVHARSLDPAVPFEAKAEIDRSGTYAFSNVPAGVEIEFTLEAPGYEPIFRYERLWLDRGVYINFGGGSEQEDPEGESYALVETIEWGDD
jgi:hypothetical protein